MAIPQETLTEVINEVGRCRDQISERVRHARDLSEREVMAAGTSIQGIVEHSKAIVSDLASSMKDAGQRDDNIRSQMSELRSYLVEQDQTVERALGRTTDIAKAGAAIKAMAAASRLLALNARVEAARLDGQNRVAFGVIADEMRELSNGVEAANRSIAKLATELLAVLPQIRDQGQQMQSYFEKFHGDVQGRTDALNRTFSESLTKNEAEVEQIRALAYEGLSHLAFQDPMIQSLQRIERTMSGLKGVIESRLQGHESAPGAAAAAAAQVQAEAEAEQTAGDVLLF